MEPVAGSFGEFLDELRDY